jgi:hypothetical protein
MSEDPCLRLQELLRQLFKDAFDQDLSEKLRSRGRELWVFGIDAKKQQLVDICGTIGPSLRAAINSRGFRDTDAGFKADAHEVIPTAGKEIVVFLLNVEHFQKPDSFLEPLLVHELAHYLEQIGDQPTTSKADEANAAATLASLTNPVRRLGDHNEVWAQHLASGARRMVAGGKATQKNIREFLEAAIPWYDRTVGISVRE